MGLVFRISCRKMCVGDISMLLLNQLKVAVSKNEMASLKKKIAKELHINEDAILSVLILRKSVDARKKDQIFFVYNVSVSTSVSEKEILKKKHKVEVLPYEPKEYKIPKANKEYNNDIVIIGAGPAGLFAAYYLALCGLKPIVLERGKDVDARKQDILDFWETGVLNTKSNVQFGEGGAGTFSDGKLNTLVKDSKGRNRFVLETFVKFGAPEEILYDFKPHIGTDILIDVIKNLRNELIQLGVTIRFESKVEDFVFAQGRVLGVVLENKETISCKHLILAIGHSARDTFFTLHEKKVNMSAKEFAVGFRVEHKREFIDRHQYGDFAELLGSAPYKLACKLNNGRGVYSFCMCPGGYVVNSSSEENHLVVNGMSYSKRDGQNSNSAIVVSVGPKEFDLNDPLSAISYQRQLEHKAYELGGGRIPQQLLGDYVLERASTGYGSFASEHKGKSAFCDLTGLFSKEIRDSFLQGMELFDHKMRGFFNEEAILSGVESRTSSPIRIWRDDCFMSSVKGLYPCGEGAGYAGGITSAAMDGLKVAEKISEFYV